jgi:hypothetical protein
MSDEEHFNNATTYASTSTHKPLYVSKPSIIKKYAPEGILNDEYFEKSSKRLRNETAKKALATPFHLFPIIDLGSSKFFAAKFSAESGRSRFFVWKGGRYDDVTSGDHADSIEISELGLANLVSVSDSFINWTHKAEEQKQLVQQKVDEKKLLPPLIETVILESTESATLEMGPFKYEGSIGGGVAIRQVMGPGISGKRIWVLSPWQFWHFVKTFIPFIQDTFEEVNNMFMQIRNNESVARQTGDSNGWKKNKTSRG